MSVTYPAGFRAAGIAVANAATRARGVADAERVTWAAAAMAAPEVPVRVRVGGGPGRARVLGCDLSYEYVRINGEYTT